MTYGGDTYGGDIPLGAEDATSGLNSIFTPTTGTITFNTFTPTVFITGPGVQVYSFRRMVLRAQATGPSELRIHSFRRMVLRAQATGPSETHVRVFYRLTLRSQAVAVGGGSRRKLLFSLM